MNTLIFRESKLTAQTLDILNTLIHEGDLVVFPTETVYGIGGHAMNDSAIKKIYQAKGRPSDNPLILHIANLSMLNTIAQDISDDANVLIERFWPGPLTLVFKKQPSVSPLLTGHLETVAVRFPNHPIARQFIEAVNVPIAAPSANLSGRPSSTLFEHVYEDLNEKVAAIVDGGPSTLGLESTVLDVSSDVPILLRPGTISADMIETVLGKPIQAGRPAKHHEAPKAPGMKYKHYQPRGHVTLYDGPETFIIQAMSRDIKHSKAKNLAVIAVDEIAQSLPPCRLYKWGSLYEPQTLAKHLYERLRTMDEHNHDVIFIHGLLEDPLSQAVMNRLEKAAHRIIKK